jgi:hypothetical protein
MARLTTTAAAKEIRNELKVAFPGIKFRVRSHNCSINVTWTNGPTIKVVSEITWKYRNGHFDGMIDCYEYANDGRPGGADYVFCDREYSDDAKVAALATLASHWGDWASIADYQRDERLYQHLTATTLA